MNLIGRYVYEKLSIGGLASETSKPFRHLNLGLPCTYTHTSKQLDSNLENKTTASRSVQENNKRETKMRIIPSNQPFNFSLILLVALTTLLMACGNDDDVEQDKTYTGKFVIQGACMHYVIQVNDTDFPQELIEKNWIHEASGIEYENVFSLRGNGDTSESVCDFPEDIKEGDSFKFMIGHKKRFTSLFNECSVCDAYSPVPKKYLSITVIEN